MRRLMTYAGQIPLETDLLHTNKETMLALGYALQALIGTGTVADGLACTPTTPASMSVIIAPGSIYTYSTIDGSPYSSLGTDTGSVVKQGILYNALTTALTAPGTVGYSINYLIQAEFTETDDGSVVLPYYNSSDPSIPWSGPSNSGAAQYTQRSGYVTLNVKAGTAAATGSQTTPAVDAGYVPLWVVTVAYGQTTITSGNIVQHASAPFIGTKLPAVPSDVQSGKWTYAAAGGTANALTAAFVPTPASLIDGMVVRVKAASSNTGAATLNGDAIVLENGSALTGGELRSGVIYEFRRNGSNWVLSSSFVAAAKIANTQNLVLNPLFRVNQDAFAGGAVSAGTYAIDMWGAPAGVASNMSFASGVATISSGNMKQVVEDPGYALGSVTLAWNGTATCSVNGASAAASPITFTHASGNISIVFGTGTVSKPMMAQGTAALPFVAPSLLIDKLNCFRYYFVNTDQLDQYAPSNLTVSQAQGLRYYVNYPTTMRIQAPVTLISYTLVDRATGTPSPRADYAGFTMRVDVTTGSGTAGVANLRYKADARIAL